MLRALKLKKIQGPLGAICVGLRAGAKRGAANTLYPLIKRCSNRSEPRIFEVAPWFGCIGVGGWAAGAGGCGSPSHRFRSRHAAQRLALKIANAISLHWAFVLSTIADTRTTHVLRGTGAGGDVLLCLCFRSQRAISLILFIGASTLPFASDAQEDADGLVRFAPGATGAITQDLVEMMTRAKREAIDLEERLTIQGPMSTPDYGIDAKRDAALLEPRVLELLGAGSALAPDGAAARGSGGGPEPWANAHMFVFASFSLPDPILKELLQSADAMGVPVVFRSFHENSVYETNDALMRIFDAPEDIKGFSIDPTLFRRFVVTAVPTVVVLKDPYEMCTTQACSGDVAPPHDRIAGSLTLQAALEIIERGRGDADAVATRLLAEVRP